MCCGARGRGLKRTCSHLIDDERRKVKQWRHARISPDVIAERLWRHRSTVFQELNRNHVPDEAVPKIVGYYWLVAKMKSVSALRA